MGGYEGQEGGSPRGTQEGAYQGLNPWKDSWEMSKKT